MHHYHLRDISKAVLTWQGGSVGRGAGYHASQSKSNVILNKTSKAGGVTIAGLKEDYKLLGTRAAF